MVDNKKRSSAIHCTQEPQFGKDDDSSILMCTYQLPKDKANYYVKSRRFFETDEPEEWDDKYWNTDEWRSSIQKNNQHPSGEYPYGSVSFSMGGDEGRLDRAVEGTWYDLRKIDSGRWYWYGRMEGGKKDSAIHCTKDWDGNVMCTYILPNGKHYYMKGTNDPDAKKTSQKYESPHEAAYEKGSHEKEEEKHEEPTSDLRNLKWRWAEHKVPGMQHYVPRTGIGDTWNMPADRDALVLELQKKMQDPKAAAKQYETRAVEFADVDYPERRMTFADFTKALDWLKLASNIRFNEKANEKNKKSESKESKKTIKSREEF